MLDGVEPVEFAFLYGDVRQMQGNLEEKYDRKKRDENNQRQMNIPLNIQKSSDVSKTNRGDYITEAEKGQAKVYYIFVIRKCV